MERKSLSKLKQLLLKDKELCEWFIEGKEDNQNPQVKEMVKEEKTRLEALNDILNYIDNGNKHQFRKL